MQDAQAPRRIGMFGGAFDPPHGAHRALAEAALQQLALDRLHVLPTGMAWHKTRTLSPPEHRVAMCRLAFGDLPGAVIDEREIHRAGPSYTADTLAELRGEYPHAELFLVLGADQLLAFKTWVRWQEVAALATLAEETDLSQVDLPFRRLVMPLQAVSATAVRARLARSEAASADGLDVLVPPSVASYISQHHLYQTPT